MIRAEIVTPEIVDFADPLKDLAQKLAPHIKQGEYGLLLIEGPSARLPGEILRRAINHCYANIGLPAIPTKDLGRIPVTKDFLCGDFRQVDCLLKEDADILRHKREDERSLVVTEFVRFGQRIKGVSERLLAAGLKFDVATVFATYGEEYYCGLLPSDTRYFLGYQWPVILIERLEFFGEKRLPQPAIYHKDRLNIDIWQRLSEENASSDPEVIKVALDLANLTSIIMAEVEAPTA